MVGVDAQAVTPVATASGGEAIARALRAHGVDTVFGIPGAQIYGLFDAFQRTEGLRVIGARHEQTCGYMAFGYARSSGRPSVFAVVPGPGILNTGAALLTAFGCNQPVLALTGQVPTPFLGVGRGHLHEMPDQLSTLRGFTKWAERIDGPADAGARVAEAFQQMRSGRPGPAVLEMAWDRFTAQGSPNSVPPLAPAPAPAPAPAAISKAVELLVRARAPMILVGGGAIDASDEIRELAEALNAPVVSFRSGRGILDDDHDLAATCAVGARLWADTDVLVGVGTRLELPDWRWLDRTGVKQIRIEIDPTEMGRSRPDVPILADASTGVRALLAAFWAESRTPPSRRAEVLAAKDAVARDVAAVTPHAAYLKVIREVLPRDGFIVDEMCQAGFVSWFAFPVHLPRTFVSSGYQGTLGFGFPTALGVKVAHPSRPVVCLTGDGGFMFAAQELATAVQHRIGVVVLVFNNGAFGNVRRDQQVGFGGRLIGCDLVNPDFVNLAAAFDVKAERVHSPETLRPALSAALDDGGPRLIEVVVAADSETSPWPFIQPRGLA